MERVLSSSMESKFEYALPPQTGRGGASAIPPELMLALWNARCEALGNACPPKFGTLQRFLCTTFYKQYPDLNSSATTLRVAIQSQLTCWNNPGKANSGPAILHEVSLRHALRAWSTCSLPVPDSKRVKLTSLSRGYTNGNYCLPACFMIAA